MKRMVLLILVLLLMVDLAEDGFLGNGKVYLPNPSAKTSVTSSPYNPVPGQSDSQHEAPSPNMLGNTHHGEARPVRLQVPPPLQIRHYCHLSSSGGIPL